VASPLSNMSTIDQFNNFRRLQNQSRELHIGRRQSRRRSSSARSAIKV